MNNICGACKHGHDKKTGGEKPSPGTVWCAQRSIQMGKSRQMPCFIAAVGIKATHCLDCKRAKMLTNVGVTPQLGNVWCEKRHVEINKQRCMGCFEP